MSAVKGQSAVAAQSRGEVGEVRLRAAEAARADVGGEHRAGDVEQDEDAARGGLDRLLALAPPRAGERDDGEEEPGREEGELRGEAPARGGGRGGLRTERGEAARAPAAQRQRGRRPEGRQPEQQQQFGPEEVHGAGF